MSQCRTKSWLAAALLVALVPLAGCGFKGDLVHPDADEAQPDKAEPAERDPAPG